MESSVTRSVVAGGRARLYRLAPAAGVLALLTAVFSWVYATTIVHDTYLVWSDLYEYFLPGFLSPYVNWSTYEFGGVPTFADFSEPTAYPVFLVFSKVLQAWTAYVIFAYVMASFGTYLYVSLITRSRAAGVVAGLGFGVSETMLERLSHLTTIHAIAWMPFVFCCLERLLATGSARWVGLGALSVAMVILAGHPQPAMYACVAAVAYAAVAGRVERRPRRYWAMAASLFALGGLLTLVKVLPFAELTLSLSRDTISLDHFVSFANTPAQMWSMLFPTVIHEGRESPTYIGLGLTIFAMLAATRVRTNWRIAFWMVTAAIGIVFGLGTATPIAELAYRYVPLYDKFRVAPRHLILTGFGLAVLAGFGLHAALQLRLSLSRRLAPLLAFAACFGIGLVFMTHPPDGVQFEFRLPLFVWAEHGFPAIMANEVWTQTVLAAVILAIATAVMFARWKLPWIAMLAVAVFVDGMNAQPYHLSRYGLDSIVMPRIDAEPSVHAITLRNEVAPQQQRVLAIGNTSTDALVPATWARIWSIPIAGGYGPMLFDRLARLATMGRNGGVTNRVLAANDAALDVLAVKEIMVKAADIESSGTIDLDGITWEKQPLDLAIGRADCAYPYPRQVSLALPDDVELAAVHTTMYLRCAEDSPQGEEVGSLTLVTADGRRISKPLQAGIDVAEAALTEPSVLNRAQHRPTRRFLDPDAGGALRSIVTMELPSPTRVMRLEIAGASGRGWLTLGRLTLVDAEGRMLPQAMGPLYLRDRDRWRELRRVRTSRASDRGRDEDASGETEFTIVENRHALPRVWLAGEVRSLKTADVLAAIKTKQFPDGAAFDPSTVALIADDDRPPAARKFAAGPASVTIEQVGNGRMAATVTSSGGGFLVFSENFYRGWRADVDGVSAEIHPTDYALQGIELPAGTHRVTFSFRPLTMYIGGLFSSVAVVIVGFLVSGWRRTHAVP
jgi:hypothetical protein